jgi:hypothetical protein
LLKRAGMTRHHLFWLAPPTLAFVLTTACSGSNGNPAGAGGAQNGSGGDRSDAAAGGSSGKGGSMTGGTSGSGGDGGSQTGNGGSQTGDGGGSGGASGGTSGAGGGTTGGGSGAGGAPATGGVSATGGAGNGGTGTGGAGTGGASGVCNTIANVGSEVPEQSMTGSPPAMTGGGPLPDGTYMLIQRQDWQGSCNCIEQRSFAVDGNVVNYVSRRDRGVEEHATGTITYAGNQLTIAFTCGPPQWVGQSMTVQYTYNAGLYKTYDTNGGKSQVETYLNVPPGGCTDLVSNQAVTSQPGTGPYPTPAGGAIADGTYLLSKYEIFPPDTTTGVTRRGALRFTGNKMEGYEFNETSGFSTKGSGTYTVSGTTFTTAGTCPPAPGYTKPFTATATEFVWFETNGTNKYEIWTYTKQ